MTRLLGYAARKCDTYARHVFPACSHRLCVSSCAWSFLSFGPSPMPRLSSLSRPSFHRPASLPPLPLPLANSPLP
eukprot:15433245-Alexandrium_andersonii.AAC.1